MNSYASKGHVSIHVCTGSYQFYIHMSIFLSANPLFYGYHVLKLYPNYKYKTRKGFKKSHSINIKRQKWQFHVQEMRIHLSSIPSTISSIRLKMIVWKKKTILLHHYEPRCPIQKMPILAAFEKILIIVIFILNSFSGCCQW